MGCLSACWAGITPTLVSQFIPVPQISGLRYRAKVQSLLPAIESSPPREFFLEFVQLDTHFTFSEIIHQCQDYFYVRICVDFSGEFGLLYLYTNTSYLHPEHCFWCADSRQDVTSSIVDVNTHSKILLQASYQNMDATFVGLIFSVFDFNVKTMTERK